jgi:integrase
LASVTPLLIERWKSERRRKGISAATLNRDIVTLKAAISRAVEWGFLSVHPLSLVKPLKVDNNQKVRYLQPHEEERLLSALDEREDKIRQERRSANQWRLDRGLPQLPDLTYSPFVDYLKPMVQLTLNTGMRRGEVFHLHWKNIHFDMAFLTIEGENAKSGSTRHIPLNDEALSVLRAWREFSDSSNLVFPGKEGKPLDNIYTSWQNLLLSASITNFRWHDMRHHFASKLVMVGVDLNTVRELLGHADLKMTLRYAHLAPHIKAEAVAKLVYSRKG